MKWIKELYKYYHISGKISYSPPISEIKKADRLMLCRFRLLLSLKNGLVNFYSPL
jgi:hypothetical protein